MSVDDNMRIYATHKKNIHVNSTIKRKIPMNIFYYITSISLLIAILIYLSGKKSLNKKK